MWSWVAPVNRATSTGIRILLYCLFVLEQWSKKYLTIIIERWLISLSNSLSRKWFSATNMNVKYLPHTCIECLHRFVNAFQTLQCNQHKFVVPTFEAQRLQSTWLLASTCSLTVLHCLAEHTLPWWIGWNVNWWLQLPQECRLWRLWSVCGA